MATVTVNVTLERIKSYGQVLIPTDFDFSENLQITRPVGSNGLLLNVDIDQYRTKFDAPIEKYIDAVNGSDSNSGDNWANAYKTITKLISVSYDKAYFKAGNYPVLNPSIFNGDQEYICVDGMANFSYGVTGDQRTWTDETGGVWSNILSANITVVCETDKYDTDEHMLRYEAVDSLAEVQSTSGSFWKDTGTNRIYIHTFDDLTPDRNDILLSISRFNSTDNTYLENIRVICGFQNNNSTTTKQYILAKSSDFCFNTTNNNVDLKGNLFVFFDKCQSYKSYLDGFAYYDIGGYSPNIIEVFCQGYLNGENNITSINNGSTSHGETKILRIGGVYWGNEGPNVHDVNDSKSLNIDCVSYDSRSITAGNKSAFALGAGSLETCKMWLDGCVAVDEDTFGAENRAIAGNLFGRYNTILNIEPGTTITTY